MVVFLRPVPYAIMLHLPGSNVLPFFMTEYAMRHNRFMMAPMILRLLYPLRFNLDLSQDDITPLRTEEHKYTTAHM